MSKLKNEIRQKLDLPEKIGQLDFFLETNTGQILRAEDFHLARVEEADGLLTFHLERDDYLAIWQFCSWGGSYIASLKVRRPGGCDLKELSPLVLELETKDPVADLWANKVPSFLEIGFDRLDPADKQKNKFETVCALFPGPGKPGFFAGTLTGQKHIQVSFVEVLGEKKLAMESISRIIAGLAGQEEISSEKVWFSYGKSYQESLAAYLGHSSQPEKTKGPVLGFNTWDYYYNAIRPADILENADAILADPVLSQRLRYIIIDAGWQHVHGEWYANHRFPEGLSWLCEQISGRGFIPGIWTAPLVIDELSWPGLRNPELLLKDQYGDPLSTGFGYAVDPTAPAGAEYILALYKRLYNHGFRLFKIDYLEGLRKAPFFHDRTASTYDAFRKLFSLIRAATGPDVHLLGCSWPHEAGPGYADSTRITVDIHNQWIQLLWVVDHIQNDYFIPQHIIDYDFDFLVVRGKDTSLEEETNVLNPLANNPDPQGLAKRWRRGPVFNYAEARTWAGFVLVSGGNLVLSDRLAMLNEKGRELVSKVVAGFKKTLRLQPLDLFGQKYASFWLQSCQDGTRRLLVVNFADQEKTLDFDFAGAGLVLPADLHDFWSGDQVSLAAGKISLVLPAHGSTVLQWREEV